MKRLAVALVAVLVTLGALVGSASAQQKPEFRLGFKVLADQIPAIAGQPLEDEHWGDNGDSLQQTTTGLMAWRKADNWTAFTDGSRTWVNGPSGVQDRANDERFGWESPGQGDQAVPIAIEVPLPPTVGPIVPLPTVRTIPIVPLPTVGPIVPLPTVGPIVPLPTVGPIVPLPTVGPVVPLPTVGPIVPLPTVGPVVPLPMPTVGPVIPRPPVGPVVPPPPPLRIR